eukprot:166809_1
MLIELRIFDSPSCCLVRFLLIFLEEVGFIDFLVLAGTTPVWLHEFELPVKTSAPGVILRFTCDGTGICEAGGNSGGGCTIILGNSGGTIGNTKFGGGVTIFRPALW